MSHRVTCALALFGALICSQAHAEDLFRAQLDADWRFTSSANVKAGGAELSRLGFDVTSWRPVRLPSTVVGALLESGQVRDPYVGQNLRTLPGAGYPLDRQFDDPLPKRSPFRHAFWFRRELELPKKVSRRWWLRLDGINYRANLWLNGKRVASATELVGAFRRHELDVTQFVTPGERNVLALEVFAPEPHDLAFTWIDWNPSPPDKNMGLWDAVHVAESGPLRVRHPQVVTELLDAKASVAKLSVRAEVENANDVALDVQLRARIGEHRITRTLHFAPHERRVVHFWGEELPPLLLQSPRLWWPYRMGPQNLYTLELDASVGGVLSDRSELRFGIQQMTSELTPKGHRLFKINGQPLLIRGAGWTSDMLLRPKSRARLVAELRYVREIGLNTIRLEGKFESDLLYELTDELGILVMAGFSCCDQWERWDDWEAEDHEVALLSIRDVMLRLRGHPSVLAWLNASDRPPPPEIEQAYLEVAHDLHWQKPILSSASETASAVTGPSGVKMLGPYDYVPPVYWLADTRRGGGFGFATEVGVGGAIPPRESLKRMFSARELWPINAAWKLHARLRPYNDIEEHLRALAMRYGPSRTLEELVRKSQALSYETERAMFEAYARNKYEATGVIQWMLSNAWPSLTWHLYDYFLRPAGGYYGAKKGCEPLHVQFSYDERSVVVVNDLRTPFSRLRVTAELFDSSLQSRFRAEQTTDVAADGVVRVLAVPEVDAGSRTYFLRLQLHDESGALRSDNFYWLSQRPDVLDWQKSSVKHTPTKVHADFTGLSALAKTELALTLGRSSGDGKREVTVKNTGAGLAFQVHLQLIDSASGEEPLPVYWADNYIALMPGEERRLWVESPQPIQGEALVRAGAWNAADVQAMEDPSPSVNQGGHP
jgi:exo-1,4-beta-D-glucosaminidase